MNKLQFRNTHYEEAIEFSQQFAKSKETGYSNVSLVNQGDQVLVQQNNTILALLTSLHYRLTVLETQLLTLENHIYKDTHTSNLKETLESINKDLSKLSLGKTVIRQQPTTYKFLTYKTQDIISNGSTNKETN